MTTPNANQSWRIILRRLVAFVIDYIVIILPYILSIAILNVSAIGIDKLTEISINPTIGQIIGFFSITLPVGLYFIILENWRGATIGKGVMSLKVSTLARQKATLWANVRRNAFKLLPWEIAHWAVWHTFDQETLALPYLIGFILSYSLVGLYFLSLVFTASHRTLYDIATGIIIHQEDSKS